MQYGKVVKKFNHKGKKIILRYPKVEDANQLLSLTNSLIKEKTYILLKTRKNFKEELDWLLRKIKNIEEKNEVFLVVEIKGKIVGSCIVKKGKEKQQHVGNFGISLSKEVRNIGLGQKIIPLLLKEAKRQLKIKMVILKVINKNHIALHVYEKLGFKKTGEIKKGINHFGQYLNEIIMVKFL